MDQYMAKIKDQESQLRQYKQLSVDLKPICDLKTRLDEVQINQRELRIKLSELESLTRGKNSSSEPNFKNLILH